MNPTPCELKHSSPLLAFGSSSWPHILKRKRFTRRKGSEHVQVGVCDWLTQEWQEAIAWFKSHPARVSCIKIRTNGASRFKKWDTFHHLLPHSSTLCRSRSWIGFKYSLLYSWGKRNCQLGREVHFNPLETWSWTSGMYVNERGALYNSNKLVVLVATLVRPSFSREFYSEKKHFVEQPMKLFKSFPSSSSSSTE